MPQTIGRDVPHRANKNGPHIEKPSVDPIETPHAKDSFERSPSESEVKPLYMQQVDGWFHELIVRGGQESDVDY